MAKVSVKRGVADRYAASNETIVEYSVLGGGPGGLISFRTMPDGRLVVDLYRHDPNVEIRVGKSE
jgi:hypothetical protein